jgi:5-hydroxyisourate hydrolase
MSAVTTHVLDTALGRPAADVRVRLEQVGAAGVVVLAQAPTNGDGRVPELGPGQLEAGVYRLVFGIADYCAATGQPCFFPEVSIAFELTDPAQHYHVPLLLSPYAYSTYRGS